MQARIPGGCSIWEETNMKKQFLILLLAGSLCLAGCGGKGSYDTGGGYNGAAAETTAAAYDYKMEAGMAPEPVFEDAWEGEATAETAASQDLSSPSGINQASSSARKLIRNVYMNVETDAFDDLITQLQSKITQLAGYVEQSDISGSSITYNNVRPNRYASITARIPSDKLDQFILVVEDSGNVTNKSESTLDVTLQYSDLESRKKTLTVEQDRIWSLLEKADTLEAVIALEERLSEIRYDLESMESQLRLFDNQVEYSTIAVSIHEVLPVDFTPIAPESVSQRIKKGFAKNVENVSETLTDLFIGIIVGIPIWLPLLAALALILAITWRIRKGGKKKACSLFRSFRKKRNEIPSPDSHAQVSQTDSADKDNSSL